MVETSAKREWPWTMGRVQTAGEARCLPLRAHFYRERDVWVRGRSHPLTKKYCLARTRDNAVMKATKQAIPPSLHKQKLNRHYSPITTSVRPQISSYVQWHPNTRTLGWLLVYWVRSVVWGSLNYDAFHSKEKEKFKWQKCPRDYFEFEIFGSVFWVIWSLV